MDIYENCYNFVGELVSTMRKTYYNDFKDSLVLQSSINYDLQGRKTSTNINVNNNTFITTDSLVYNELGQLKNKLLHINNNPNNPNNPISNDSLGNNGFGSLINVLPQINNNFYLENILYTYNPRGWLLSALGTNFSFRLGYENPINGAIPQFNGNISWQEWRIGNNLSSNYKYFYDKVKSVSIWFKPV